MIPFLEVGMQIINKLIPDPEQKAKAEVELLKATQAGAFKELDQRMSAIVMEAQSKHMMVALARPSFLYVMYVYILGAIPVGALSIFYPGEAIQLADGMKAFLAAIPGEMWTLFGAGYLGYVKKRSDDKEIIAGREPKKFLGLF